VGGPRPNAARVARQSVVAVTAACVVPSLFDPRAERIFDEPKVLILRSVAAIAAASALMWAIAGRRSIRTMTSDIRQAAAPLAATALLAVTGFMDWKPAGGRLTVADGIGQASEATSGILALKVRLFPSGGGHLDGVLTVNCRLADATFDIEEGITLAVGSFFFVQDEGQTLFHVPK